MKEERIPLIKINGLKTYFPVEGSKLSLQKKYIKAVDNVDIVIYKGKTLGIVGESGCGKTTLGKTILQLVKPTNGEVIYEFENGAKDLIKITRKEMNEARRKMSIVFQDPQSSLNPAFTIYGSMSDILKKFGYRTHKERRNVLGNLLEEVNMPRGYVDRYPNELSGGQKQRIGIARALCLEPELIICDEAVSALDVSVQAQVLKLLKHLKEEKNLTYIFISHDMSVIEYVSDYIAVMYLGKIIEQADADDIYHKAAHPYTKALLSAIPVADIDHKKNRILLEGDVPSPLNMPSGCRFYSRCPKRIDICSKIEPELKLLKGAANHLVACHLANDEI